MADLRRFLKDIAESTQQSLKDPKTYRKYMPWIIAGKIAKYAVIALLLSNASEAQTGAPLSEWPPLLSANLPSYVNEVEAQKVTADLSKTEKLFIVESYFEDAWKRKIWEPVGRIAFLPPLNSAYIYSARLLDWGGNPRSFLVLYNVSFKRRDDGSFEYVFYADKDDARGISLRTADGTHFDYFFLSTPRDHVHIRKIVTQEQGEAAQLALEARHEKLARLKKTAKPAKRARRN